MLAIERKNEILSILQKEQRVLVSELSQRYEVTEETIRRDLEKLEREGFVKKTYGGAVLNKHITLDMPLKIREQTNRRQKQAIAKKVAGLVEDGDCLMLDSSSTSLMIARELKQKRKLTVITNSVEVLIELAGNEEIQVISTGGKLRDSSLSLIGRSALEVLSCYHVDKAILSCKGMDPDRGVSDSNEEEAQVKIQMRACARETILAADSSKLGGVYFVKVMDLRSGDTLVTDRVPDEWRERLEEQGVRLVLCNVES